MRVLLRLWAIVVIAIKRLAAQRLLSISTLLGLTVAVALMMTVPLYAEAVSFRILQERLYEKNDQTNRPPFSFMFSYIGSWSKPVDWDATLQLDKYLREQLHNDLGLPQLYFTRHTESERLRLYGAFNSDYSEASSLAYVNLAVTEDIENHITILEGTFPAPADSSPDSVIEVMVTETFANEIGIQIGELYQAYNPKAEATNSQATIPVKVSGIWIPTDTTESFWFYNPTSYDDVLLIHPDSFVNRIAPYSETEVYLSVWYMITDGSSITSNRVEDFIQRHAAVAQQIDLLLPKTSISHSPIDELRPYQRIANALTIMLTAFSVPIITLVITFISMVIGLSIEKRRNEMAVLRSRGTTAFQIIGLVVIESLTLGSIALALGTVIAIGITLLMGHVRSFMDFTGTTTLVILFPQTVILTAALAVAVSVVIHVIPTLPASRHTIVTYKIAQARSLQRPFWQRIGIDYMLLVVTAYFYYQLTQQGNLFLGNSGVASIEGASQNPLLYLLPPMTIFAFTLIALRIMPLIVRFIGWVLHLTNSVGVLMATHHLERTPSFYILPSILLICTISLGIFTASFARTLDRYLYEQQFYRLDGDTTVKAFAQPTGGTLAFSGVDLVPLDMLINEYESLPGVDAATRIVELKASTQQNERSITGKFLAVDRADFSRVSFWRLDFASQRLGALMNSLAYEPDTVLVSREFLEANSLSINDFVRLDVKDGTLLDVAVTLKIVGTFDYFPRWYPEEEGPLFVGNMDYFFEKVGTELPYLVLLRTNETYDKAVLNKELLRKGATLVFLDEPFSSIIRTQAQPDRQGLFGMLSIGFVASALVTVIGFFLYTLFSYQRRYVELGVLRAIGLSRFEMMLSVSWELGLLITIGLTLGIGLGLLVSWMYIPYLQIARNAKELIPPFLVTIAWTEIAQIVILFFVLFVTILVVLLMVLGRMKVFQAVKLGETV